MKRLLVALLALLLLAACMPIQPPTPSPDATPAPVEPDASGLEGVEWTLVSAVDADGNLMPAVAASEPTLMLQNGEVGGNSGCNTYGGSYTLEGDQLTFGALFSTAMACEEDIMAQEAAFHAALAETTRYAIVDGQLELYNADGETVAVFAGASTAETPAVEPDASGLEGMEWTLVSTVDADGNLMAAVAESEPTLSFQQNGEAGGNSGCNVYGGSYTLEGDQLTFGPVISTMMACEEDIMAQEIAYFAALAQVASYAVVDGQLELRNADGEAVAVFAGAPIAEAPAPDAPMPTALEGVEWTLVGVAAGEGTMILADEGSAATATFADGTVTGSTGCNSYNGAYTLDGDQLTFGPLATTRMACEESVMAQESAFLTAISETTSYAVVDGQLELHNADGEVVALFMTQTVASSPSVDEPAPGVVRPTEALSWEALSGLTYQAPSAEFAGATPTGTYAYGEIDGVPAAAVLLSAPLGDSFTYALALVLDQDGTAVNVATEPLGEGVRVNTIHIQDGAVHLDFVSPSPDEAPCCGTVRAQAVYTLVGDQLSPADVVVVGDQAPVEATEIVDYLPETIPTETQSGSCFTNAIGLGRADAWRCTVGNAIYDPCFQIDDAPTIVCGANPATGETGFVLELTEPLPAADPGQLQNPWQIVLEDGTLCALATGTIPGTADRTAPYTCTDTTYLFDDFDATQPVVTVDRATFGVDGNGFFVTDSASNAARTIWQ